MSSAPRPDSEASGHFLLGSVVSLTLHAVLLLLAAMLLRGCQQGSPGTAGGEVFREVGLFVVDGADDGRSDVGLQSGEGEDSQTQPTQAVPATTVADADQSSDSPNPASRVPNEIPDVGTLTDPDMTGADDGNQSSPLAGLIGPGTAVAGRSGGVAGGSQSLIQPLQAGGARKIGGTGGVGETTFMNIAGVGRSFVYVIDTSSSMDGPRLRTARAQLKASLRLLQPNQQFAVILYNEYRVRLKLRRQAEQPMYFATDVNKQLAAQEIDRIASDNGTDHRPALLEALALKPDVIYFLTDGDEPELSTADLKDIAHYRNATTIHVIKFGDGTFTSRTLNWLQKLAQLGQGEYREIVAETR